MKLIESNEKFTLTEIDYEMISVIINGLDCQRKKYIAKFSELIPYMYKDYSKDEIEEFKKNMDYLREKNDELKLIIDNLKSDLENIPLK
jgi:hypothetical protein